MRKRLASLNPGELRELASRRDTVVMQHTHDTLFEPWSEDRLTTAIQRLQQISLEHRSTETTKRVAANDAELALLRDHYKLLYERICDPSIASNLSHMNTILFMIATHGRMNRNEISEPEARAAASDRALASLMEQTE